MTDHHDARDSPSSAAAPPRHFSMIRGFHLADFFTLGNAACGAGSLLLAMSFVAGAGRAAFVVAALLVPLALVLDVADGRIARWRHQHSPLGRELDSLADIVSFGVAPAALAFAAGARGGWDAVILAYFVCCGVSRLARYNISAESLSAGQAKVPYFEGTPIPTSVVLVLFLLIATWRSDIGARLWGGGWTLGPWRLHAFTLLYALSGSLMISKTVRIRKL